MSEKMEGQGNGLESEEIYTTIFIDEAPCFVEDELLRLYSHIHASLRFIQIFKCPNEINTYVARRGTTPIVILPFLLERRSIIVLTHMIRLDSTEIERFAACAFEQFPSVDIITFNSVQAELTNFPYPVIRSYSRDDVVIRLPSTADAYTATLGKSTRKNLRRYRARLQKKFPSVRFQTYEKTEIDEKIIQDLIKLSELRVTGKQMKFGTSKNYTKGMIELAMVYGVLNVISIDGHLCSGIISYRVGNSQFAEVIAHNEMYNDFSPGMLCCYWAICESITKGVGQFHMGSGLLERFHSDCP